VSLKLDFELFTQHILHFSERNFKVKTKKLTDIVYFSPENIGIGFNKEIQ